MREAGRDELHLGAGQAARAASSSPDRTISSLGMYWAAAIRHVLRCSPGPPCRPGPPPRPRPPARRRGPSCTARCARRSGRSPRRGTAGRWRQRRHGSTPMLRQKWATAATVETIAQSSTYGSSPSSSAAAPVDVGGHRAGVTGQAVGDVVRGQRRDEVGAEPAGRGDARSTAGSGSASAIASRAVPGQLDALGAGPPAARRGDVLPREPVRLGEVGTHGHWARLTGRVQRDCLANERFERGDVELVAFEPVDGAPRVAFEARVEELLRILQLPRPWRRSP